MDDGKMVSKNLLYGPPEAYVQQQGTEEKDAGGGGVTDSYDSSQFAATFQGSQITA
jgi:hypothetical protein